jgi:hypothetical protein
VRGDIDPTAMSLAVGRIQRALRDGATDALSKMGDEVARDARRACVSKRVTRTINSQTLGDTTIVSAGDSRRGFFAHIIEFGGGASSARPFLRPAAQAIERKGGDFITRAIRRRM